MEQANLIPEIEAEELSAFYQILMTGIFKSLFDAECISQHSLMEVLSRL